MRKTKEQTKEEQHGQQGGRFIDQPRDTTLHRNNAATFITGKQKKKTFGVMHQKTRK